VAWRENNLNNGGGISAAASVASGNGGGVAAISALARRHISGKRQRNRNVTARQRNAGNSSARRA
jgi:hypothetical protein